MTETVTGSKSFKFLVAPQGKAPIKMLPTNSSDFWIGKSGKLTEQGLVCQLKPVAKPQTDCLDVGNFYRCRLESGCAKGAAKGSCGETIVQKGVFGESVSSLPP